MEICYHRGRYQERERAMDGIQGFSHPPSRGLHHAPAAPDSMTGPGDEVIITSGKDIAASYYPQDPSVGPPVKGTLPGEGITTGPDNARIDTAGDVKQDKEGNLVFTPGQAEFLPVQTFAATMKTIQAMEKYLGRKISWYTGKEQVTIYPDKGKMANAFYNKKDVSLNFFHFIDRKTGETVHTGKSYDTVAHETGHALLDGLKPGFLGWNIETEALHEAVADIVSMLSALQEPANRQMFLSQIAAGFKVHNCIADTGEQFGKSAMGKPFIRTAINNYGYKNPYTLPVMPTGAEDELTGEAHNFCRVFTGAFYDVMEKIYAQNLARGMSPEAALISTTDACGRLLMKGIDRCPPSNATFKDLAKGMIEADRAGEKGQYGKLLAEVFDSRWIYMKNEHRPQDFRSFHGISELDAGNIGNIKDFIEANRERLGLGDDAVMSSCVLHRNDDGSRSAAVTGSMEVELKGPQYGLFDGAVIELEHGATLVFDSTGILTGLAESAIDSKAVENARTAIEQYIREGMIKLTDPSHKNLTEKDLFNADGIPYKGYTVYEDGKMKIVRSPIIALCHRQRS